MQINNQKACHSKGFTLIELAIVMIISGLLLVAGVQAYRNYVQGKNVILTHDGIITAQDSINAFQKKYGYFPCPASATNNISLASDCNGAPPAGITTTVGLGGKEVWIGVLPAYANYVDPADPLAVVQNIAILPHGKATDSYGNRITYAVTRDMAKSAALFNPNDSAITPLKTDGTQYTNSGGTPVYASFAMVSPGEDRKGGLGSTIPCDAPGATDQAENCDGDSTFVIPGEKEDTPLNIPGRSFAPGATYNDDFAAFQTGGAPLGTASSCTGFTHVTGISSTGTVTCAPDIFVSTSCPAGEAMVGVLNDGTTPDCKAVPPACASGEVMVEMKLGDTVGNCKPNYSGNCGPGEVQVGTLSGGGADCKSIIRTCGANDVQAGVDANLQPICITPAYKKCTGNKIQIGNNSDGSPNCVDVACTNAGDFLHGITTSGTQDCKGDQTGLTNGTCPDGEAVTGVTGGVPNCTPLAKALYVQQSPTMTGATELNAVAQEATDECKADLRAAGTPNDAWCDTFYAQCEIVGAGDGAAGGANSIGNDFAAISKEGNCMSLYCRGMYGQTPNMVYLTGACVPGNPYNVSLCDGRPSLNFSCMYKGSVPKILNKWRGAPGILCSTEPSKAGTQEDCSFY